MTRLTVRVANERDGAWFMRFSRRCHTGGIRYEMMRIGNRPASSAYLFLVSVIAMVSWKMSDRAKIWQIAA